MDINCDLGESYGKFRIGNDKMVFPYITSCNIACGQHGGDPLTISQTIQSAIEHKVQIGAHPSYPDLAGFGRRKMVLAADELIALVKSQVAIIDGMAKSYGGKMSYVKPHGALYNSLVEDDAEAEAFVSAISSYDNTLAIMSLPNSALENATKAAKLKFIREGFIDRRYLQDGSLCPRSEEQAVIHEVAGMLHQFESLVNHQQVKTLSGKLIPMEVDSLCIHGDNPLAEVLLTALRKKAIDLNITIKAFDLS